MTRTFKTAAFKSSLEAHLRGKAKERGVPYATVRFKFVLERLLARLFFADDPGRLLKGGFAMDLRFRPGARTTNDLDLTVGLQSAEATSATLTDVWDRLQVAVARDLGDYLTYRIAAPRRELTNAPGGGGRFPCEAVLAGKSCDKLHIHVGMGDPILGEPERLTGDDLPLGRPGEHPHQGPGGSGTADRTRTLETGRGSGGVAPHLPSSQHAPASGGFIAAPGILANRLSADGGRGAIVDGSGSGSLRDLDRLLVGESTRGHAVKVRRCPET